MNINKLKQVKEFTGIQILILLLTSSVLSSLVTGVAAWSISDNKITSSQIEKILDLYVSENGILKQENKKISDLEREVYELRQKVLLLESSTQNLPIPMWLKDLNGIMLALNPAYEQDFLLPRGFSSREYIGQSDYNIWNKEIADSFTANDRWVIKNKKVFYGYEVVPDGTGKLKTWYIIKYPRYASGVLVGIAGVAIREKQLDSNINHE